MQHPTSSPSPSLAKPKSAKENAPPSDPNDSKQSPAKLKSPLPSSKENAPPSDPNMPYDSTLSPAKLKSPLPPRKPKSSKENAPPSDPNMPYDSKQSPAKLKSPLPPRKPKSAKENAPPSDPNIPYDSKQFPAKLKSPLPPKKPKSAKENAPPSDPNMPYDSKLSPAKLKSPLSPRPPSSNPLKRKPIMDSVPENSVPGGSDSGVKVIVRMRPPHKERDDEGDVIVQKISCDSLSINRQTFTFDSVADIEATQQDIFQLVGAPLVENCLAGFNSSVFAYGQTGSGKTYTIWGPANVLLEGNLSGDQQGLTPRVFERLFALINEEQIKHAADKQLEYQCYCSFLEIYNEQITDLLDPNQRNLQIREDVKYGVYVENLTEESVCTIKDVTQLFSKGLSHRRIGATSINAERSFSHTVFTCVVESRCKSKADGLSCFKTSRINLVDLAGSERQKLTGAAGERLKEAGNINRSLSHLGNLINILAEVSQTGKQRHIPYRDSRLTFLLQESLGGNAKLAMVCAISPLQSCKSETFSTLRFARRAKAIKNKAVVNEVMQDDVNHLREVIRELRDELHRIKVNSNSPSDSNGGHSAAWIRRSLNLLKSNLSCPITLHNVDDDGDEEAVERLCNQVEKQIAGGCIREQSSEDTDVNMEEGASEQDEIMIVDSAEPVRNTSNLSNVNVLTDDNFLEENHIESNTLDRDPSPPPAEEKAILARIDSVASRKQNQLLQLTYSCEPSSAPPLSAIPESTDEGAEKKLEEERIRGTDEESRWIWISLTQELEASRSLAEKMKQELETERKRTEELQEAMQMAIEGQARILELYADLEEEHTQLLARHRN